MSGAAALHRIGGRRAAILVVALPALLQCAQRTTPPGYLLADAHDLQRQLDDPADMARAKRAALDPSSDPCEDFYAYACGGWEASTHLAPNRLLTGSGLLGGDERNAVWLWQLLAESESSGSAPRRHLTTFYRACLNAAAADTERDALDPLRRAIEEVDDLAGLLAATAALHRAGVPALFDVDLMPNPENPAVGILALDAPPLGLVRDWYLRDDAQSRTVLKLYSNHVERMLSLDGERSALDATTADRIVALEKRLAAMAPARPFGQHRRGPLPLTSTDELVALLAPLPVEAYFSALGIPPPTAVVLGSASYFSQLATVVANTDPALLRAFLRWQLLHALAGALPARFREEHFTFYGEETLVRLDRADDEWLQCSVATENLLGDLVVAAYLEGPAASDTMHLAQSVADRLRTTSAQSVDRAQWMTPATRQRAADKIRAVTIHFGHPARDAEPTDLALSSESHLDNVLAAQQRWFDRAVAQRGGVGDPAQWRVAPFLTTALYRPQFNDMLVPLGLLHPPVFDRRLPDPISYGALGTIIGHELFHTLDENGRKYDLHGRALTWWDDATQRALDERTQCLAEHFGHYDAAPAVRPPIAGLSMAVRVDPVRTADENLADVAGVAAAFLAYRAHVAAVGEPAPVLDDMSNERLFFVAYAQLWCTKMQPVLEQWLARTDVHAPPRVRVNGALAQVPAFGTTFGCTSGSPMRPEKACALW